MPLAQTTVSGTAQDVQGNVVSGVSLWCHKAVKSGTILQLKKKLIAVSNASGVFERRPVPIVDGVAVPTADFLLVRASNVWLEAGCYIGGTKFSIRNGVSVTIPDSATASLESLGAGAAVPAQGITVKLNGVSLANPITILDFSSDFLAPESPTGEANISLSASLIVTTEQVQDALTTFFPDSPPYDWTYSDAGNAVGLVIAPFTGDSGAGGVTGLVPAPASGDAAANKFLKASGAWATIDLSPYAPLASPTLTGTPTAPTAAQGTNTTQLSTTAFVRAELAALVGTVPATLDTLDELAQALGDDPNFATTITNALALKAPLISPSFTTPALGVASATSLGVGNGSVSAPAFTFSADTNSGFYSLGNDFWGITTGGTARVFFDGSKMVLQAAEILGWSSGDPSSLGPDITLSRNAAGILQIGLSSASALGGLLASRVVVAKTANYPVVAASDNSKCFTNAGAGGTVVFTLPTAVPGLQFTFYVDAAFTLQVTAGASTTIRIAAGVSAAAGNITNATVGGSVTLVAISATQWIALSSLGTWVVT